MHRHSTDLVGLIFGAAFALAGIGFLVHEATDTSVDPAWTAGLGLIVLGVIALAGTLARGPRREPAPDSETVDEPFESVDESGAEEPASVTSAPTTSEG